MGLSLNWMGKVLAQFLSQKRHIHSTAPPTPLEELFCALSKLRDVLLVEGGSRASAAIKFLTQSTEGSSRLIDRFALHRWRDSPVRLPAWHGFPRPSYLRPIKQPFAAHEFQLQYAVIGDPINRIAKLQKEP